MEQAWLAGLLESMGRSGPAAEAAASYIQEHGVHLWMQDQPTGARWRPGPRIDLHPRYASGPPDAAYPIALVIHEVEHLRQGMLTALSVYGELAAWHAQFAFIRTRTGLFSEDARKDRKIEQLMMLPVGLDRTVLAAARHLMREYAGPAYRVDLLPLYPLPREIAWALFRTKPQGPAER